MADVLILHPGEMGSSLGLALVNNGHRAHWVSAGRSEATRTRAAGSNLVRHGTLEEGLSSADVVISVCPPEFALDVGQVVCESGFNGVFCDANAIAPSTARVQAEKFGEAYVDGGIVGPPAHRHGSTRMYVSGKRAMEIVRLFNGSALDTRLVEGEVAAASAVKMCYAAYTKGTSAMLLAIRSLAEANGVTETLRSEWELSQPSLWERSERVGPGTTRKAWRFAPEMRQIAQSFGDAGLPSGFHEAASAIYERMAGLKDSDPVPTKEIVKILRGE